MTVAIENASPAPTISFPITIRLSPPRRALLDILRRALHEHVISLEDPVRKPADNLNAVGLVETLRLHLVVDHPHDLVARDLAFSGFLHLTDGEGQLGTGRLPLHRLFDNSPAHLNQVARPPHRLADGDAGGHGIGESKKRNGQRHTNDQQRNNMGGLHRSSRSFSSLSTSESFRSSINR